MWPLKAFCEGQASGREEKIGLVELTGKKHFPIIARSRTVFASTRPSCGRELLRRCESKPAV